jgi:integrase
VPLPPLARAIIAGVKPIASAAGYVFTTNGRSAISGWSAIKKALDAAMGATSPWRLHDLRRTAATGSEMNLRADEAYEWASMKLADTPAVRGARSATLTTPLENKCSGFIPFSCAAQLKPPHTLHDDDA